MYAVKPILFVGIVSLLLYGCAIENENTLSKVVVDGKEIPDLDPEELNQFDVKLSQIAENFQVVNLETNPEVVLSEDTEYRIGFKYIIAASSSGIYQFSIDGSYIRKLVGHGRAPGEILGTFPQSSLVEKRDLFLAFYSGRVYQFELSTGRFMGDYQLAIKSDQNLSDARFVLDSMILFSYEQSGTMIDIMSVDSTGCGIILQSLNGNVLWKKYFDYKSWVIYSIMNMKVLDGCYIDILSTNNPDEFILQVFDQDTVYKLDIGNCSVEPTMIRRVEKLKIEGYRVNRRADNCTIDYEEDAIVNGYQLMNFTYLLDDETYTGFRFYILYDDNKKAAYRIGTFINDYFGFLHSTENDIKARHNLPYLIDPGRKLVEVYDAYTFIKLAEEALDNPDLDPIVRTRLLDLTGKVTETSNPILLIGDMKKKIDDLK